MTRHQPPGETSLARLIEEVTVDCYNDDEALSAFLIAIDEHLADAAVPAGLAGFETTLAKLTTRGTAAGWLPESATVLGATRLRCSMSKYTLAQTRNS